MKITKEEVEHIAGLARLGLSGKEKEKFQGELSSVLEFVNKLNEVKTDRVEPLGQIVGLKNAAREDVVKPADSETRKKLLKCAPEMKNRYFRVKAVL